MKIYRSRRTTLIVSFSVKLDLKSAKQVGSQKTVLTSKSGDIPTDDKGTSDKTRPHRALPWAAPTGTIYPLEMDHLWNIFI